MGKKRTETTQNQTQNNTFGYVPAQITPEMEAVKNMKAQTDPTIPYRYANLRQQNADSFNNPLGSYTTPAVREAAQRVSNQRLAMDEAQATAESQYNADNENYNRAANYAQITAPRFVQTGGSSTGTSTQTQSGGLLGDILGGAIGIGANYATGGMSGAASGKFGQRKSSFPSAAVHESMHSVF
jgi:hypothetical protein